MRESGLGGIGRRPRRRPGALRRRLVATGLALLGAGSARAVDCGVPSSHATLQQAVATPTCTRVLLADQIFVESVEIRRDLEIAGVAAGATTLRGTLDVANGAVVAIANLAVSGCAQARVTATAGARVSGDRLTVTAGAAAPPCPIFADNFESATPDAWSTRTP